MVGIYEIGTRVAAGLDRRVGFDAGVFGDGVDNGVLTVGLVPYGNDVQAQFLAGFHQCLKLGFPLVGETVADAE